VASHCAAIAFATERVLAGPDGLVRIALKKPFSDGTIALDPLSLFCPLGDPLLLP
jgi:hypothetical protein